MERLQIFIKMANLVTLFKCHDLFSPRNAPHMCDLTLIKQKQIMKECTTGEPLLK